MSNETNGSADEKPKKKVRRKPLWLLTPAGQRTVQRPDGTIDPQPLYTVEKFTSAVELRKTLAARELDQTNAKGIVVFRADAIPVETKMTTQVVIKFGHEDEESESDAAQDGDEGMV